MMSKLKIRLGYIGFTVFCVLFFMVVLFPMEKADTYIRRFANSLHPQVKLDFKNLSLKLPCGVQVKSFRMQYQNKELIKADRLELGYGLLSLFTRGDTVYFDSQLLKGQVDGKAVFVRNSGLDDLRLEADFDKIRIEEIPYIQELSGYSLTGALNGRIDYKADFSKSKKQRLNEIDDHLEADINITDASVEIMAAFLDELEPITFERIEARIVKEKTRIDVKQLKFTGRQVNGTISGDILLMHNLKASKLNLSVNMMLDPLFMSKLKKIPAANMLLGSNRTGKISYTIGGTVESPLPLPK